MPAHAGHHQHPAVMEIQSLPPDLPEPQETDILTPEEIDQTVSRNYIDLITTPLNPRILHTTDEFFGPATNLTAPTRPIHRPGHYVATGAWYDGWETRRHNRAPFDSVTLRLGPAAGLVHAVEIDTAFFDGNHAPAISVDCAYLPSRPRPPHPTPTPVPAPAPVPAPISDPDAVVTAPDFAWDELLGRRACGPSTRQAWRVRPRGPVTHVRLRMYPDGGIARFRLWGTARPAWGGGGGGADGGNGSDSGSADDEVELSAAVNGGVATACSDERFGRAANLLLPGRGEDMGDGWETGRSRAAGHVDWAVVRLGGRGRVARLVVDTAFFRGNFPRAVRVHGVDLVGGAALPEYGDPAWRVVLAEVEVRPDEERVFRVGHGLDGGVGDGVFTHLRLTIVPDGGVKRFRAFGTRVSDGA